MNDHPLFSIIMPTRNRGHLISVGIKSVLEQSFKIWELVVIDDGSTDQTKEVITAFRDDRIRYHYQEHKERSTARNRGIDLAGGKYICFLDDDDYLLPNYLKDFADFLDSQNYPATILRTGFYRKQDGEMYPAPNYQKEKHFNPVRFLMFNMCGVGSICIPRQHLQQLRFPNHIYYWEDTYLFLQLLMKHPFVQLDKHQYVYQLHDEMSSVEFYKSPDLFSLVDNNISAMLNFYENFGSEVSEFLPGWTKNYILAEKYMDHAISSISYTSPKTSLFFLKKSLNYPCFRFPILKKYAIWFIRFIPSFFRKKD